MNSDHNFINTVVTDNESCMVLRCYLETKHAGPKKAKWIRGNVKSFFFFMVAMSIYHKAPMPRAAGLPSHALRRK